MNTRYLLVAVKNPYRTGTREWTVMCDIFNYFDKGLSFDLVDLAAETFSYPDNYKDLMQVFVAGKLLKIVQ